MENDSNNQTSAGLVTIDVKYEERISRLFIFRFLRMFIEIWILYVWMFWLFLISVVHFFHMLILGKRQEMLWKKQLRFFRHLQKWNAYLWNLTNVTPRWIED